MRWEYTPHVLPLLVAAAVSAALAVYAWRQRRAAGATAFAVLMAAVAEWSAAYALELAGADLATKYLSAKIRYLGIGVLPAAWLAFTLQYTGHGSWLTRRRIALLAIVPVVTLLVVLTNETHGLYWSEVRLRAPAHTLSLKTAWGPWFGVWVAFSYTLLSAGTILIVLRLLRSSELYRWQGVTLLLSVLAPWAVNALHISGLVPGQIDPTPFGFTVSGLAFAWNLFRFRLLDIVPVARDAVIEGMSDGMMVLDERNRVVDLNPAAQRILGRTAAEAVGRAAGELLRAWPEIVDRYRHVVEDQAEIAVGEGEAQRHYDVRISPLLDRRGRLTGRLVVWRDITARKAAEAEVRVRKQLFENLLAVARATTERPTLEATLENTLEVASSLTGAEGASLFLLDESGAMTHSIMSHGHARFERGTAITSAILEKGLAGWVARRRQAALVPDTREDERWLHLPEQLPPIRSVLSVPISSGPTLVGILSLVHSQPGHFRAEHLEFIQAAGDQMALALRNAQIFDARSRIADRQTILYEVLRATGGQLDPEQVLRVAVEAISQRTGWPNVVVAVPDEAGRHWKIRAASADLSKFGPLPVDRGLIGRAYAMGRTQLVPDVSADPDYVPGLVATRSELTAVIRHGGRKLGVLNMESDRLAAFGPDDVQLAESLADAVGLALENARLYRAIADEGERLQALIRSSRDGIMVVGGERRLLVVNQPALGLLRLPGRPEDWLGRPLREALEVLRGHAPEAVEAMIVEIRRIVHGDEPAGEGELRVTPRFIRWLNLPVLAGGQFLGRLFVLRDVTEEKLFDKMRDDLTHTMVHDLRNPLTAVGGVLEMLELTLAESLSPNLQEMLKVARGGARRMSELVDAILEVSRLESGSMPLSRERLALAPLVAEALGLQAPLAGEKGLSLENEVPATHPPAWADPALVGRVLQNLVDNAVKFTPEGGRIRVRADLEPSDPPMLRVAVSDTGPGIPAEVRGRLFQKFVTGGQKGEGSGLGLAFCRLAVEAHGGRIWLESEPGRGATFAFTLPVAA